MVKYKCVLVPVLIFACTSPVLSAQLKPGDLIITHNDTATSGGRTYQLDPVTGKVTTLIDKQSPPNDTMLGNWVQMAPNNKEVWVAHQQSTSRGGMVVISQAGTLSTTVPLMWRADGFRIRDDGGITWSGYGGIFTNRLIWTDTNFGSQKTLVSGISSLSLSHQEIEDSGNVVASFQSTAPDGGVAELDPVGGVIIQTLKGLALTNTVDFHKRSGNIYAVEFAIPGQTTVWAGSLYEIDLATRKITSLIDGTTAQGAAVDRLNWIECGRDNSLFLGARHRIFKYDLTSRSIVNTWLFEKERLQAITGATVYGSRPLLLDTSSGTRPGTTIHVNLGFPHTRAAGASYYLACSLGLRPGVQLGNDWLDLQFDIFFFISANNLAPAIFQDFQGILDQNGDAEAAIAIPDMAMLDGLRFFCGGFAVIGGNNVVTNSEGFTIRKQR